MITLNDWKDGCTGKLTLYTAYKGDITKLPRNLAVTYDSTQKKFRAGEIWLDDIYTSPNDCAANLINKIQKQYLGGMAE